MLKNTRELFGVDLAAQIMAQDVPEVPERVPEIDTSHVFEKERVAMASLWYLSDQRSGLYLYGPTGSGKSSFARQFMARLNRSVYEFHSTPQSEPSEFKGGFHLKGGDTVWVDGPLTAAARVGAVLLIDELDMLNPGCGMVLKSVLDGGTIALPELGEYVAPEKGFRVVATGNTAGNGDAFGRYASVRRQNIALMNCFAKMEVGYMPEDLETTLLRNMFPKISEILIKGFVGLANGVREHFIGKVDAPPTIDVTLSTRDLIRTIGYFSILIEREKPMVEHVMDALSISLPFGENATLKESVVQILQRMGFA